MNDDEEELLPRVSGGYDMKEEEEEIRRRRQEEESAMWIRGSPIESYVLFIKNNLHAVVASSLFFVMFKTVFLLAFAVCFGWREWFFMFESSIFAIVAATLYLEILHVGWEKFLLDYGGVPSTQIERATNALHCVMTVSCFFAVMCYLTSDDMSYVTEVFHLGIRYFLLWVLVYALLMRMNKRHGIRKIVLPALHDHVRRLGIIIPNGPGDFEQFDDEL